jgi:3-oxoacyl-[acyl-carrier-protein] synthase II
VRRVVVTGIGILSPVGNGKEAFFDGIAAARSGVRRLSASFADRLTTRIVAPVDFDGAAHFPRLKLSVLDRTTQLALIAAREAVADAALELNEDRKHRAGVYWGTGMGSAHTLEDSYCGLFTDPEYRARPAIVVMIMNNAAASQISLDFGLRGPSLTYSTACSSSAVAIGEAFRAIRHGLLDCAVAGGAEALLTHGTIRAWQALQIMAIEDPEDSSASCRPFSRDRTGFVLGEGAAAIILEEAEQAITRGARVYGELAGYGSTSDAHHLTKPDSQGQARAIAQALREAELAPADIGYINAHGTATAAGDVVETQAIKLVFGDLASKVPVSSTKAVHGHLMGATGATEFIAALLAMRHGKAPPTAHLRVPDPECDLDYVPNVARSGLAIRAVISNSFAFGGNNAVLVAKAWK